MCNETHTASARCLCQRKLFTVSAPHAWYWCGMCKVPQTLHVFGRTGLSVGLRARFPAAQQQHTCRAQQAGGGGWGRSSWWLAGVQLCGGSGRGASGTGAGHIRGGGEAGQEKNDGRKRRRAEGLAQSKHAYEGRPGHLLPRSFFLALLVFCFGAGPAAKHLSGAAPRMATAGRHSSCAAGLAEKKLIASVEVARSEAKALAAKPAISAPPGAGSRARARTSTRDLWREHSTHEPCMPRPPCAPACVSKAAVTGQPLSGVCLQPAPDGHTSRMDTQLFHILTEAPRGLVPRYSAIQIF